MPVGGRVTFTAFDGSERKSGWLLADSNGIFPTWGVLVVIVLTLTGIIGGVVGINPLVSFAFAVDPFTRWLGFDFTFGALVAITLLTTFLLSFVWVFVLRHNFTVIGPRRQFRYICSWL